MRILRPYPLALAGATLAAVLSVSTMTANAATTFLMQFGQHDSEQAAQEQWDALRAAHPDVLGDKQLRIAPVTSFSGDEVYRTQASGVANRAEAQEACSALAKQNVQCFVVETSMFTPTEVAEANIEVEMTGEELDEVTPQAAAEAAAATASLRPLPWLGELESTPAPVEQVNVADARPTTRSVSILEDSAQPLRPEKREQAMTAAAAPVAVEQAAAQRMAQTEAQAVATRAPRSLDTQLAARNTANTPTAVVAPQVQPQSTSAEVEVAEAIQVPLSFDESFNNMINSRPAVAPVPVNKPVGHAGYPSQPLNKRTLWVQMSQFASKDAAMAYWRELTATQPELMRLLRVRIVTPWSGGYGRRYASLRMGPFESQADIDALCNAAAARDLKCNLVRQLAGSTSVTANRQMATPQQRHDRSQATNRSQQSAVRSGMFWMQLGAFDSVTAAQERWQQLKTVHADVLGRMEPQISYPAFSSSPTPVYHLRTGPFVNRVGAVNACNRLQTRHLGCVVVQTR